MAKILLNSLLGPINVDISRDGTLSSEDMDLKETIDYDRSMMEFGEEMSDFLMFVDFLDVSALQSLIDPRLISNDNYYIQIGTDFVEHVKFIYKLQQGGDLTVDNAVELLRGWQFGDPNIDEIREAAREIAKLYDSTSEKSWSQAYNWVAQAAHYVVHSAILVSELDKILFTASSRLIRAAESCQMAMALYRLPQIHPLEDQTRARSSEQKWQFRRIIDVVDAIQAGKEIPTVSETR